MTTCDFSRICLGNDHCKCQHTKVSSPIRNIRLIPTTLALVLLFALFLIVTIYWAIFKEAEYLKLLVFACTR